MIIKNLIIALIDLGVLTLRFWIILIDKGKGLSSLIPVKYIKNLLIVIYWIAIKTWEKVTFLPILID